MGAKSKSHGSQVRAFLLTLLTTLFLVLLASHPVARANNPGDKGPCSVASKDVAIGETTAKVFYPMEEACADFSQQPFAAIAFAHGFSMFGLSDGVSENVGNGEHLASWGYIVAVPALPDDAEERVTFLTDTLDFLESANADSGSFLYGKVDTDRLAAAGHSLGGATALATAARDKRVSAVVALDPVYHTGDFAGEGDPIWDPAAEAPDITIPTGILGAPPSSCNAEADYADIYPLIGADHKGSFLLNDASHCVFADPGSSFCGFVCSGSTASEMTMVSKKYMSAWFNYYLQRKAEFYDYLFGTQAQADAGAGLIKLTEDTHPTDLVASKSNHAVALSWNTYQHPILAGYKIYKRLADEPSFGSPFATLGLRGSFTDFEVVGGSTYVYAVRSFDIGDNLHQLSEEISITLDPSMAEAHKGYIPMSIGP